MHDNDDRKSLMRLFAPAMIAALAACSHNPQPASQDAPATAFTHASVLAMSGEARVLSDQTVIVQSGRIAWVGPATEARPPRDARVIDATGKYLLPGLADMHVHTGSSDFPLLIANGVTTVREMNGSPTLLAIRDSVRAGTLLGPTMYVAGPLLAGVKQRWRHVLIQTPEEARAEVQREIAAGYDYVKAYSGLSLASYDAIVATARGHLPVVGHIPRDVGLEHALASGQCSLEHMDQIVEALAGNRKSLDSATIDSGAAAIARAQAWVTPTLAVMEVLNSRGTKRFAALYDRPEMRFVDADTRAWWNSLRAPMHGATSAEPVDTDFVGNMARAYDVAETQLVRALHRAGVRMLLGTDFPNPLMVPGFAAHDELDALVRTGIPPYDALAMATTNAAAFTHATGTFGVIAPGARADILLVDADPLRDLSTLRHPVGVMLRGRWLDRAALDAMLERAVPR
jgi:imidazolonepropionase-like amidohydrolase